ncbi:MAG TPA: 30S ribosomal protein S20 [Candidatus Latescibacteria bacterium]|nr:30S ribosomal protein S20 [Candidatus Latescibacterota bacterium]
MPHTRSAKKNMRKSHKARLRNRSAKSAMRTAIRKVLASSSPEEATEALRRATSVIDRTAKKGIIHKNTAARYKSRLARIVQNLVQA